MNMDYPELPKPKFSKKVDGVPTITVTEHEALMRAYVEADRAQRAAQPPQQSAQPVAEFIAEQRSKPEMSDAMDQMRVRIAINCAFSWLRDNGEIVFAGGGMAAVDSMNAVINRLRDALSAAQPVEVQPESVIVPRSLEAAKLMVLLGTNWLTAHAPGELKVAPVEVHRVPLTADEVWSNNDLMALNAELGLTLDQFIELVRAIESANGIKPTSSEGGAA